MATNDDLSHMRPLTDSVAPMRQRLTNLATPAEVMDAARNGDSWAFDRLFAELARPLRAFAVARGAEDPDGLVNEVLSEVFASLPSFDGDSVAFRGFVFYVARRRVIDEYRRRARRPRTTPRPELGGQQALVGRDEPGEMTGLATESALRALAALTDDQRDVLVLRIVCDLGLAETAAALDTPVTAIKALQRRGIAALRRKISDGTVSL